jgi:DHA2 family multidrug resistance protein
VGFSCLFVPLSTVALTTIPRHKMADATGLNSLFRQVGGSVGLAIGATLLTRYATTARVSLIAHLDPANAAVQQRLSMATAMQAAHGTDAMAAQHTAVGMLEGIVQRQAMLLAFNKVFLVAGISFLFVLPLLIFLKVPDTDPNQPAEKKQVDVHME